MTEANESLFQRVRRVLKESVPPAGKRISTLRPYLFAFVLSLAVDLGGVDWVVEHLPMHKESCQLTQQAYNNWAERLFDPLIRLRFLSADHTKHDVAIVSFSDDSEPANVMNNVCEARTYTATLIKDLVDLGPPKVIAIDKFYSEGACDPAITTSFVQTLVSVAQGGKTSIVVGQKTGDRPNQKAAEDCLMLSPALNFGGTPDNPIIPSGLTRLNSNTQKIPLFWWAYVDSNAEHQYPGFAMAAAMQADPSVTQDELVKSLKKKNVHPYTSLLKPEDIPTFSASRIVCEHEGTCKETPQQTADFKSQIKNAKVIVIGEFSQSDTQSTPSGDRYGSQLQASYIQALVGKRTFVEPINKWVDGSLAVIFFLFTYMLEAIGDDLKITSGESILFGLGAFAVLSVVALSFLLRYYFTPLFLLSSSGIVVLFCQRIVGAARENAKSKNKHKEDQ